MRKGGDAVHNAGAQPSQRPVKTAPVMEHSTFSAPAHQPQPRQAQPQAPQPDLISLAGDTAPTRAQQSAPAPAFGAFVSGGQAGIDMAPFQGAPALLPTSATRANIMGLYQSSAPLATAQAPLSTAAPSKPGANYNIALPGLGLPAGTPMYAPMPVPYGGGRPVVYPGMMPGMTPGMAPGMAPGMVGVAPGMAPGMGPGFTNNGGMGAVGVGGVTYVNANYAAASGGARYPPGFGL